ncbi:MAG TPA: glycosyltransferase [Verrucomicrobiae bacterium]|nr:glycosyltransferase [Verrucomicrobiae bacterium]
MKICMMTNTYLPHVGGVARSVHTFSEAYRRLGHKVLVVAPQYEGPERVPAQVEKRVVRLAALQQFNGSDFSVRLPMTWQVNPVLYGFKPNIVHSHHPYLLGDSALRYAADQNAPVVFTHHTLHEEYTHYVPFDSSALKQFVIELCTQYANLCDAVIAPSQSIASLIEQRGVTTPIEVIPTGIDGAAFAQGRRGKFRKAYKIPENAFVVGHLGRLAPEKNLAFLGRAVAPFLKESRGARFLVVGDGPSTKTLQELFDREQLAERLILPGAKTGRELADAYAAMDVFVFSSFSETQGLVLTEAMAAGLPVVALDASGVREVVRDGKNGLLLDAGASEIEFAAKLAKLEANQALRHRLSVGAKRTSETFSREVSAEKALALYDSVLRRTRRERAQVSQDTFGTLLKRIEVEWKLIAEKAGAIIEAARSNPAKQEVSC